MNPIQEEMIWNKITESAKSRFDYSAFEEIFPFDPDNIIFKIIVDFATNKPQNIIALELFNELLLTGNKLNLEEIEIFLEDKKALFKREIFASKIAGDMLSQGNNPTQVYNSVTQLL